MSLSRVFKKSSSIIYSDVVSLHLESSLPLSQPKEEIEYMSYDAQLMQEEANELILKANLEAKQLHDKAVKEAEIIFNEHLEQLKKEAYEQALAEHQAQLKTQLSDFMVTMQQTIQDLNTMVQHNESHFNQRLKEETVKMSLAICEKVLSTQLHDDSTLLKSLILKEVAQETQLQIHSVELSKHAHQLVDQLEFELKKAGIELIVSNHDVDHIMLIGDYGQYDLSISTQLQEIRKSMQSWL